MVAGVEIHDRRRGERDRATAATTVERSPSVSPSVPIIFFSQKSVRLEDVSGGGLFCLVFRWQGDDVVPAKFGIKTVFRKKICK